MRPRVHGCDELRIGKPVERKAAGKTDDMPAVNQAPAVFPERRIEVDAGSVLPKAGRRHVVGLLDRDSIDMIDRFARHVVTQAMGFARENKIIIPEIQPIGDWQFGRTDEGRQRGR